MAETMYEQNRVDEIYNPLYDTLTGEQAAALTARIQLFTVPVGPTRGTELTNMQASRELPAPESFDIHALRIVPIGMLEADVIAIMKAYVVRLSVGLKSYLEAPLEYFAAGAGSGNGIADPRAINVLPPTHPIKIEIGSRFQVQLDATTAPTMTATAGGGKGCFLRFYLEGLHRRPVQ